MKSAICIFVLLLVSAASAEKQPFERYQSIVDRQMFGPLPPGFDPTKSPNDVQKSSGKSDAELTQDQAKLKSAIRFFVIDTKADGSVAVGFTDNSDPKAPKNYYLKVGETRDGWEVKEADPETAKMTIAKGEVEVSLTLGGNSASGGGTSAAAAASPALANGVSRRPGLLGGGVLGGGTLRARRLQRQQEAQAQAAAQQQEAQAQAEAKEAERQAQAEAEKQQREQERAEQRQQLLAIQEELKKVREAKAAAAREESANEGDGNADDNAQ